MDTQKNRWKRRLNGSVEIRKIPREDWDVTKADHLIKAKYIYTWRPPYQLACQLPDGFALSFGCWVGESGFRRFHPIKPCGEFVFEASLAGHAIRSDRGKTEREPNFSQHEARLFNQFSRFTRDYLGKTVKLGQNLGISQAGQPDAGTKDILPDVGLTSDPQGERWSVARLKREGLEAAQAAGIEKPTADQILWHGLLEAARLSPLSASKAEAGRLMRLAFYTVGTEGVRVGRAAVGYVTRQVRASLHDHLDDSREEFDRWIQDRKSNLISRIAKRSDCRWSREEVRMALVKLGWCSFKMLAECIDACSRAFAAALPKPLSRKEKQLFARMYFAHDNLGGIPLVLLHDRFDLLKQAVLDTWNNPGSHRAVGVLRRMIWFYAELASARRAGDRQCKKVSTHKNQDNRPASRQPLFEDLQACDAEAPGDIFREIALRAARAQGSVFDFAGADWDARLQSENATSVVLNITCPARNVEKTLHVPRKEFERIAIEVKAGV